jgi:hypothetical protein
MQSIQTPTTGRPAETPTAVQFLCVMLTQASANRSGLLLRERRTVPYLTLENKCSAIWGCDTVWFGTWVPRVIIVCLEGRGIRSHILSSYLQVFIPRWPRSTCGVLYFRYKPIFGDFGSRKRFLAIGMLGTFRATNEICRPKT